MLRPLNPSLRCSATAAALAASLAVAVPAAATPPQAFLDSFSTVNTIGSTVPANGDVNPYGVAVVPRTIGALQRGSVLVSNFNNSANLQGTGTTIVEVAPNGTVTLFASLGAAGVASSCPGGIGLTTALAVFESGWVIVGSLPSSTGLVQNAGAGCLVVLDSYGNMVETFTGHGINGPWDMAALDEGDAGVLFVSNVLNGSVATGSPHTVYEGTIIRIELELPHQGAGIPHRVASTVIGSGFAELANANSFVIGPTGVALGWNGTLYVADTFNNRIAAIPNALYRKTSASSGRTVSEGGALNGPLGLIAAPNGNVIASNGGDGNLVEVAPDGSQVAVKTVDSVFGAGALFGLAVAPRGQGIYFADDGDNTLKEFVGPPAP